MDDWFSYHCVPKKEKLSHAIRQLTGSAYKWWKGVDGARWKSQRKDIKMWEDLKEAMIRKYVSSFPTPEIRESLIHQVQIRPNQGHTVFYDQSQPYEVQKTMGRKNFVSQDTLARHKEKSDKPIFQENAKDVKTGSEVQKDTISTSLLRSKVVHDLSLRDKEILNPKEEEPSSQGATLLMEQKLVQDTMQSMLLKEEKPVIKVSHQVPRKEPDHKLSHEPPHKWKPKIELRVVQMPRLKVSFSDLKMPKTLDYPGSSWPDDYLSWERTMDDWFTYYGVPKKERIAHAIKQLSGKAYSWWKRVDKTHGKSPEEVVTNWKDLKDVMIRKYVTTLPTQETRRKYPRRFSNGVSKEAKKVVPQQGHRSLIYQDQIRPSQMPTVLYDKSQPYEVPKTMERKKFVSQDTLARHKEKSDKPIFQEKTKVSPILDKFVYKSSPTGMSHLSLSKDAKTGPEVQKYTISTSLLRSKVVHDLSLRDKEILNPKEEEPSSQGIKEHEFKGEEPPGATLVMEQKLVQDTMQSMLLKEAKPGEQMKAICLLKFQGNNQTISSAMNHLISGSLKLN
ncbi:hypothetical protein DY000_02038039 [Brassica cretica]|uniref:Retrotransposon gag domain-containing protein n=1 Tax=Brassica cretica TaxID=69181 RepID=A0ABQ7BH47_BRACR|nr:hypothetical protein DY000_02038039 [Brassica cretica]